jgi:hypothetical protein
VRFPELLKELAERLIGQDRASESDPFAHELYFGKRRSWLRPIWPKHCNLGHPLIVRGFSSASYFPAQKWGPNLFGLIVGLAADVWERRSLRESKKSLKKTYDFPGFSLYFMIHCYQ